MVGPNSLVTALHAAFPFGHSPVFIKAISNTGQTFTVDVTATQDFVDQSAWYQKFLAQGGASPSETATDIAVLKTDKAIGFDTGWFQLYDLDNGKVWVFGYPGGVYKAYPDGTLEDTSWLGANYSHIAGVPAIPGTSGGLVMDTAGHAVAVVSGGGDTGIGAVDLSPELIAKVQGSIAVNDAAIAPEIAGRESYFLAHQLSAPWAELNLSSLVVQQNWASVTSTFETALLSAIQGVGPDVAVDFIAGAFGISLSPADHQALAAEMEAHPVALIGVLEQAMLPLMGTIPM
jgi:hypothetical protein